MVCCWAWWPPLRSALPTVGCAAVRALLRRSTNRCWRACPKTASRAKVAVVDLGSESLYAEKIRELRTCMRFAVPAGHEGPPRTIAITSPTMEEGRTTTAIDLAAALAESGKSVVLVDADMRHSAIAEAAVPDQPQRCGAAGAEHRPGR